MNHDATKVMGHGAARPIRSTAVGEQDVIKPRIDARRRAVSYGRFENSADNTVAISFFGACCTME
jgi:hypothetical protein